MRGTGEKSKTCVKRHCIQNSVWMGVMQELRSGGQGNKVKVKNTKRIHPPFFGQIAPRCIACCVEAGGGGRGSPKGKGADRSLQGTVLWKHRRRLLVRWEQAIGASFDPRSQ